MTTANCLNRKGLVTRNRPGGPRECSQDNNKLTNHSNMNPPTTPTESVEIVKPVKSLLWLTCDDCHQQKEDVKETICPYNEDVNNEIVPAILCEDCYYERAADI